MAQAALVHENLEARLVTATVLECREECWRTLAGNVSHKAGLAASCLLRPEPGDMVLLACLENGEAVIVSVLNRNADSKALLRLPDESALECLGGLDVRAARSLKLQSADTLALESKDLDVAAINATAKAVSVKTVCDRAHMCCRALTTLGHTALSAFRSLTQCLGESKKMVEGADETHCGTSTLVADESATVMSTNSLSLAKECARTDAKLIQLG